MAVRDFLILMIKLFGMHSAVLSIFLIPSSIIEYSFSLDNILYIIWIVVVFALIFGLFWVLTFEADKIVDLFKFEKGFTESRIELGNIKSEDIIKTGTFIIGGLIFINNLPVLLSKSFWAFQGEIEGREFILEDKINLGKNVLNVVIGYLLFTNFDLVAKRMMRKKDQDSN
jgi:hypothetical protein